MGRDRRSLALAVTCACVCAPWAVEGCTFINTYSDLTPQRSADASTGEVDATFADQAAEAATIADVTVAQPTPSKGVIAISGTVATDGGDLSVLTALDPRTGSEFPKARVPMNVAAIAYDPVRDYWYVFESGGQGVYPTPADPFFLHVRTIDRVSGAWTELAEVQLPPGVSAVTTAVLGGAVTYVAYGNGDAGTVPSTPVNGTDGGVALLPTIPGKYGLVTVDTHDLTQITACVLGGFNASPISVVGTPNSSNPQNGYATLGQYPMKGFMTPVLVPAGCDSVSNPPVADPMITLPTGNPGFGLATNGATAQVLVASKGFGPGPTLLTVIDPSSGNIQSQGLFSGFNDGNIHAPAYSECLNSAYVIGTNTDTNTWFVSLNGAAPPAGEGGTTPALTATDQPMGHSGQSVYFEPFTKTVLLPFSQGDNFKLTAFRYNPSTTTYASITNTPLWAPPPDLRPNFVATRTPVPFDCTPQDD